MLCCSVILSSPALSTPLSARSPGGGGHEYAVRCWLRASGRPTEGPHARNVGSDAKRATGLVPEGAPFRYAAGRTDAPQRQETNPLVNLLSKSLGERQQRGNYSGGPPRRPTHARKLIEEQSASSNGTSADGSGLNGE